MSNPLPRRVWTDAEMAANRAATHAEWGMERDWSDWINDMATEPATCRAHDQLIERS